MEKIKIKQPMEKIKIKQPKDKDKAIRKIKIKQPEWVQKFSFFGGTVLSGNGRICTEIEVYNNSHNVDCLLSHTLHRRRQ